MSDYELVVLFDGYSIEMTNGTRANCTCSLLKSYNEKNIIVDTMTAWDGPIIVDALKQNGLNCTDIDIVVCTHGHSDHIGCNYLFPNALHIVGYSVSRKDFYMDHDFIVKDYKINEFVRVTATPGHTMQDVSVVVSTSDKGLVVLTGDLFENEHDLLDENIWIKAGSDSQQMQRFNRQRMLDLANWIVPGHGRMFKVSR